MLAWIAASAGAGPLAVGWADDEFDGVPARVFYPAEEDGEGATPDLGAGPYPLAGFLHGWLGSAWMYDEVCIELASWGYVVASLDTQTGLFLEMDSYADEAAAMMRGVDARSREGDPLLGGLVSDADWVAVGHSMGGGTLPHLLALEPRIRTAVQYMPYEGYPEYYDELSGWDGSLLILSGTHDTTAPPVLQDEWFASAGSAARLLLVRLTDVGHKAVTDLTFGEDPIPDDLQREVVITLGTTFVRAEHGGDEDLWAELTGAAQGGIDATAASDGNAPVLWATPVDGEVEVGVASRLGTEVALAFGPSADPTGWDGGDAASLSLPDGIGSGRVPLPAVDGDLWVAARAEGGWTRAVQVVDAPDAPPPVDEDEDPADGSPAPDGRDSCGCASLSGPVWPWPVALLGWRRRWRARTPPGRS
jgi:dienelactone hydrolase